MIAGFTPLGQPPESIESGHYSTPPRAWWWVKQSFIYFVALMGMKVVVLVLFLIAPWLARVGDWALRWTEGNEELQIFFVMMLFPLIMNAFQYYVIDTYIKEKVGGSSARDGGEHMPLPQEDDDEHRRRSSSRRSSSSSDSDDDASSTSDAESLRMGRPRKKTPHDDAGNGILHRHHHQPPAEYDPDVDGDHEVVPGSRPSRRLDRNGSVNKTVPK